MRNPQVISSTMGQANESPLTERRPYRWRGRQGWPFDPATHDERPVEHHNADAGNAARMTARQERLAAFAKALKDTLAEGLPRPRAVQEAGRRIGVQPKTARSYAADLKAAAEAAS